MVFPADFLQRGEARGGRLPLPVSEIALLVAQVDFVNDFLNGGVSHFFSLPLYNISVELAIGAAGLRAFSMTVIFSSTFCIFASRLTITA